MVPIIFSATRLDGKLQKALRKGELDEQEVHDIARHLLIKREDYLQIKARKNSRLKVIFPLIGTIVLLMALMTAIKTGQMLSFLLPFVFALIAIGIVLLLNWLNTQFLRDFVKATHKHYPALSAHYKDVFFPKKQ